MRHPRFTCALCHPKQKSKIQISFSADATLDRYSEIISSLASPGKKFEQTLFALDPCGDFAWMAL
jgi:hypothetical protein